jgi:hypothetical protein
MTSPSDSATKNGDGVSNRLHDVRGHVVKLKDDTLRGLGKRLDSLGMMMQKHPLLSLGIGLGVGYLVARIVHRG